LTGRIEFEGESIDNLLKQTIFGYERAEQTLVCVGI
jgi:hypothetical protein